MAINRIVPFVRLNRGSPTMTNDFQKVDAGGTFASYPGSLSIVRIINASDKSINISYDGTNEHDHLQAGDTIQLDLQANANPNGYVSNLPKNFGVWVAGSAGAGSIYVCAYGQIER